MSYITQFDEALSDEEINSDRYSYRILFTKRLNRERKRQAKRLDILCNDFISAQREFIKRLRTISFTATFYEAIAGTTNLESLLYTVSKLIRIEIPDSSVAFFLLGADKFELHMFECDKPTVSEECRLENYLTPELVDNICKSNKLCTLEDMFGMGLQGSLTKLKKISAVTLPLCQFGSSLGFVLVYRSSENKIIAEQLSNVSAVTCGLSRAIQSCQMLLHSAD